MAVNDHHQQQVRFLLPLSMTCRSMRLRLLPWIWKRIECLDLALSWSSEGRFPRKLNAILEGLGADAYLAVSVKYLGTLLHSRLVLIRIL